MRKTSHKTIDALVQAKQPRINGRLAYEFTAQRKPFRNSNNQLYARWLHGSPKHEGAGLRYVVYSYGAHWPLFIWCDDSLQWYSNSDKYGTTTSKHYTQSHPRQATTPLSLPAMKALAFHGYAALVQLRLEGNAID